MFGLRTTGRQFDPAGDLAVAAGLDGLEHTLPSVRQLPDPDLVFGRDGAVEISVWDTDPALSAACAADTGRVGQHGLEITMAVCRSFEVRREPVGKRVKAASMPTDDPGGDPAGHLM
ncbi:hypothetical protein [Streptomyces tauricus]|uniref:hypothetical protein n=1 Tax=Streptomyces tauricus TaxID=68274 RepID=UPI003F4B97ED